MDIKNKINEFLSELLEPEYFVVDIEFVKKLPLAKLTILIDGDNGIGIDTCVEVSRQISAKIEEIDLIESAYNLEVSSPGIDRPLVLSRQYTKNIGRNLKVLLNNGTEVSGVLQAVDLDLASITLQSEAKRNKKVETPDNQSIALQDIKKANVLISFK